MNQATLNRLKKNPHYKMSPKQAAEAASMERKPMIEFGAPGTHDNHFAIHDTNQVKRKRFAKDK